jgi:predicted AlkP superfamily phosphohydrolase/phosphomutase
MTQIGIELLAAEPWDFSGIVLGSPHRGGHYLWDDSQLEQASPGDRQRIGSALEDVYIACDKALEQLLAVAPGDALKVVFAVHGMTRNHGWGDLGADLLEGLLQHAMGQKPRRGLLYDIRRRVPMHLARPLLSRLPQAVTGKLVELWSANMYNWETTPYFPVPMDQAGYIRVNLKGREKNGIVEPGAEYEQLCDTLEEQLMGLYDADSGQGIVSKVVRAWLQAPDCAQARDLLPDLVVVWGEHSTRHCRRVASRQFPEFTLEVPPRNVSGRSGNHVGYGWFVAQGHHVGATGEVHGYTIRDFAPSIFNTLGATPLADFESQACMW